MKKIIYTVGLMLALTSCNFLETDISDYLSEETLYRSETSCLAGLAGVYTNLATYGAYGQNIWGDLDAGTDIMVQNRAYNKDVIQIANNNYNNTDAVLKTTWSNLYAGINCANDYIYMINQRTDDECGGAKNKKTFIAEAKAVRALYYMNLVAFWGEVPLRLTSTRDLTQQQLKKAPQDKIYAQIIEDLKEATEYCAKANELNAPGRISQTTAEALLARAYMWQSGYPVYANTWDKALEHARNVKKSGLHQLWKSSNGSGYSELFINMCSNKYDLQNRESMFEIEFFGNGMEQVNRTGRVGLYAGISQGAITDPEVPYIYAWYDGTKYLFKLYTDANDKRKWWNFSDYKFTADEKSGKVSKTFYSASDLAKITDGNVAKWRAEYDPIRPWAKNNSSINFPVMRYSDVLLMIAECANEVGGPTQESIDALNDVRTRAGITTLLSLGSEAVADKEKLSEFIFEERTRELCYEVPRRIELRRQGKDFYGKRIKSLLDPNGVIGYKESDSKAVAAMNYAEKHLYFPIPQAELNTNVICGQNENW